MPQTSQTFLRSSDCDFVEKVTKAFLSADIALCKLNNKHVKNLFSEIGHRFYQRHGLVVKSVRLGSW